MIYMGRIIILIGAILLLIRRSRCDRVDFEFNISRSAPEELSGHSLSITVKDHQQPYTLEIKQHDTAVFKVSNHMSDKHLWFKITGEPSHQALIAPTTHQSLERQVWNFPIRIKEFLLISELVR